MKLRDDLDAGINQAVLNPKGVCIYCGNRPHGLRRCYCYTQSLADTPLPRFAGLEFSTIDGTNETGIDLKMRRCPYCQKYHDGKCRRSGLADTPPPPFAADLRGLETGLSGLGIGDINEIAIDPRTHFCIYCKLSSARCTCGSRGCLDAPVADLKGIIGSGEAYIRKYAPLLMV